MNKPYPTWKYLQDKIATKHINIYYLTSSNPNLFKRKNIVEHSFGYIRNSILQKI